MEEKNNALIELKDLYVDYVGAHATVHAVNGINLTIDRGETFGLVGETGAGKTTTALSILGLLPERTGRIQKGIITFDGVPMLDLNEKEMQAIRGSRISMIFQDPMTALNPVITVGKQIEEALFLHNTDGKSNEEINARVDEMLTLVGIDPGRKNEYPHQFSGGMKQRVVIAIALACSPELLIADEPTTALDVTIQAQVLAMMVELKKKFSMSILMITHDLGIVAKICDKVAVMYAGEIMEYGTFEDFFINKQHHPYTDGLFGSIPNIDIDVERLTPIKGMPTDPTNLPEGCKFHPRCPKCMEICKTVDPEYCVSGTHGIKCHLYSEKEV